MKPGEIERLRTHLAPVLRDEHAVQFCVQLLELIHVWDDLIDRDHEVDAVTINRTMLTALIDLPLNPFYHRHIQTLAPLLLNASLQWQDANSMEGPDAPESDLNMAWMLRASVYQIFAFCAFLLGGMDYAREVGPTIRRMYGESLQQYREEMHNA